MLNLNYTITLQFLYFRFSALPQPFLLTEPANNIKTATFGHTKNKQFQLKNVTLRKQLSDESIDEMQFEKCRLSLKSPTTPKNMNNNNTNMINHEIQEETPNEIDENDINIVETNDDVTPDSENSEETVIEDVFSRDMIRKDSDVTPDIVRGVDLTEDDLASHRAKLEELQLKQKLMEEQNKKRKEMLSKALADR